MPKHFTNTITIWNYGNDARNICDFSLVSKVCREFDDVTSAGKLYGCSLRGDGKRSVADSGQSCRRNVQCPAVLGQDPLLHTTRRFFPRGGRNHRQYSLHPPVEGWPGWVGLDKYRDGIDLPKVVSTSRARRSLTLLMRYHYAKLVKQDEHNTVVRSMGTTVTCWRKSLFRRLRVIRTNGLSPPGSAWKSIRGFRLFTGSTGHRFQGTLRCWRFVWKLFLVQA